TKRAFILRNAEVADPTVMRRRPADLVSDETIDRLARDIDPARALPWPHVAPPGHTIWSGAIDRKGCAVSFSQSLYWEVGCGVVREATGTAWQNRGSTSSLAPAARNALAPGRRPFHTLNPAGAVFQDGRCMVYGTMGGEGQPQSQAAIFTRYARFGQPLQQAI